MTIKIIAPLLVAGSAILAAQTPSAVQSKIDRGRYLTEEVGKCQMCHSPRADNGELDKERWLKGAVLDFAPMKPVEGWHKTSPDITGASRLFQRWGDEGMMKFMTTGLTPKGTPSDPPMPAYKMSREDAEALVAYLKSLK